MLRQHENAISLKAGALSIVVHTVLLAMLLVSFNWKTTHTVSVAEVELWDSLPQSAPTIVREEPKTEQKIEPKIEPPVAPEVIQKTEPAPEPKPALKTDIALDTKPLPKETPKEKPKKKEIKKTNHALEDLQKELRQDELQKEKVFDDQRKQVALHALQQELLDEGSNKPSSPQTNAASANEINKYKALIQTKIHRNVNKTLCGDSKPELVFEIALMPTGYVQGAPKLIKSSNINACDDAVERAILQSQPLPLPDDANLRMQFRELTLKFRPNDDI